MMTVWQVDARIVGNQPTRAGHGRLQEAVGVAESSRYHARHLPRDVRLGSERNIFVDFAGAAVGGLNTGEHRRGVWKEQRGALARHARDTLGSASELSYYLILAHDLGYLDRPLRDDLQSDLSEVRRMLTSLERVSAMAARRQWPTARLRRRGPDLENR
jgi:hypothetical protein